MAGKLCVQIVTKTYFCDQGLHGTATRQKAGKVVRCLSFFATLFVTSHILQRTRLTTVENDRIAQLQEIAKKLKIRNASRLLQASKGKVPGATLEAAKNRAGDSSVETGACSPLQVHWQVSRRRAE